MPAEEKRPRRPHSLTMENRESLRLTGVNDVDSFDDGTVVVFTDWGELVVRGENLRIGMLDTDSGQLNVSGTIGSLLYMDQQKPAQGLLGKLFR